METIKFIAIIPDIQSAVKIGGDGSARIQLDVPTTEMPELMKLIAYGRDKPLKISVGVSNDAK